MEYRKFPGIDVRASLLSMGCMRLPTKPAGDGNVIDRELAIPMIRSGIDRGINYLDTAYGYHNKESQIVVGLALQNGYRERVTLATKLPHWSVNTYEDMEKLLDESLEKLQVDVIDFYLVHALGGDSYVKMRDLGVRKFLDAMVKKGKIRYPAFSFHDGAEAFETIITDYPWVMAQVQMNYLDEFNQATLEKIVKYSDKVGMIAMEPLRGGALVATVPSDVQAVYDSVKPKRKPVEWAFRWLYDMPEFVTILSGMSSMAQLDENLAIFEDATSGVMTADEKKMIERARVTYERRIRAGCTGCEYCLPCPAGVKIPRVLQSFDEAFMFDRMAGFKKHYQRMIAEESDGGRCTHCGKCEELCPQKIKIISLLEEIHKEYGA